jgi:hypothetical protein
MRLKASCIISIILLIVFSLQIQVSSKTVKIDAKSFAKVTKVMGTLYLNSGKNWQSIGKNKIVKINNRLKTGAKSRAEITFIDGSRIRLDENTDVILVINEHKKENKNIFKMVIGRLWAKIINNGKDRFAIQGTTVTLAVLGTTFEVDAAKSNTDISVFNGSIGIQLPTNDLVELNKNLDELKLKADNKISNPIATDVPVHEVEKPVKLVSGPYEVSKDKWLEIIENQKISVNENGIGTVSELDNDKVKEDEWIQWNKELDSNSAENILFIRK